MTRFLTKTYEMHPDPPPAMARDEYEAIVSREWRELLNSEECRGEIRIQRFLETHPCMVPGAFHLQNWYSHSPYLPFVITQPPLQGIGSNVPDFMWIAGDSETLRPVLVEIETPEKRWFTKAGHPTAQFTQAHHQLAQWKDWMSDPSNQGVFYATYGISGHFLRSLAFKPHYILVYGRRSEFASNPELNRRRAQLHREDETIMTFDRLESDPRALQMMCVARRTNGFEAISVPATFTLGPGRAEARARVHSKDDAVRANPMISTKRKQFLLERIRYWDEWAKEPRGVTHGGDYE